MPEWKGTVGTGLTPRQFERHAENLHMGVWRPQFVVLHNTGVPKLADWHKVPGEKRMDNLENYYRNQLGWSAGPHLFVADDLIWLFTPLTKPGVHSPSWNALSWGVEMVGDFASEPFSPRVRDNTVVALAALHARLGLDSSSLRLHKEDPKTDHDCPGKHVGKADMISRVHDRIIQISGGDHPLTEGGRLG